MTQRVRICLVVDAKGADGIDLGSRIDRAMSRVMDKHPMDNPGPQQFTEVIEEPGFTLTAQYAWVEGND